MYISKKTRELVKNKYNGRCAYTGTILQNDWQIDHANPLIRNWFDNNKPIFTENHNENNMLPTQKLINHYKHSMDLEQFRFFMKNFHLRIAKLPKNPKTEKSQKRKKYMNKIAMLFDITEIKPFNGKFYFETLNIKQEAIYEEEPF